MPSLDVSYGRALDANGATVPGALLYIYRAGTTTPVEIYDLDTLWALPFPLEFDANGRPPAAFILPGVYDFILKTPEGVTLDEALGRQLTSDDWVYFGTPGDVSGGNAGGLFGPATMLQAGDLLYVFDPGGTAQTTADGYTYSPANTAYPEHWGAARDGVTDDTAAVQAALAWCITNNRDLAFRAGTYLFDGGKLDIDGPIAIRGEGRKNTFLRFTGTPPVAVTTREQWRSEYNGGDYSLNSDPATASAIRITADHVSIRDLEIVCDDDLDDSFTTPFDSDTDYPTSNYAYGVHISNAAECSLHEMGAVGTWAEAALLIEGTAPGTGIGDGFSAYNCDFFGVWGVQIMGPQGEPISGEDYEDLVEDDTRCAQGISDVVMYGCNVGDTSVGYYLSVDGATRRVARSTGGALKINGQLSRNSSKRIQGISFVEVRFSCTSPYALYLNYCHRVEFYSCHTEKKGVSVKTDGVTELDDTDVEIYSTENAQRVLFVGGEKSGETDALTRRNSSGQQTLNTIGWHGPTFDREMRVDTLSDQGTFTPVLAGASTPGSPTFSTNTGHYVRLGQMVWFWIKMELTSKGGMSGTVTVSGLPFQASGVTDYASVMGNTDALTTGDAGLSVWVDGGTQIIRFEKKNAAGTVAALTDADLTDTTKMDLGGFYATRILT